MIGGRGFLIPRLGPPGGVPTPFLLAVVCLVAPLVGVAATQRPYLALVASIGAVLTAVALVRPQAFTPLALFLLFLNAPAVLVTHHGVPAVAGLLLSLGLLTVPFVHVLQRGGGLVASWPLALIAALFAVQCLSTVLSGGEAESLNALLTFVIEGLLIYFLVSNVVRTPAALRIAMWSIVTAGALLGALSLYQRATGTYSRPYGGFAQVPVEFLTGQSTELRLAGPVGDPNYYAQFLLVPLSFAVLGLARGAAPLPRLAALACTGLISAGIVLTLSRGVAVALVLGFAVALALRIVRVRQAVVVLAAAAMVLALVPGYGDRLLTIGDATSEGTTDQAVQGRETEAATAALVFLDHPLIGVGPGLGALQYQEYAERVGGEIHDTVRYGPSKGEAPTREAHNMFLQVAAEIGLAGLLVFIGILVVILAGTLRARRRFSHEDPAMRRMAEALFVAIVLYLGASLFLSLAYERYFWALLGLAGAAASIARTHRAPAAAAAVTRGTT